MTTSHTHGEVKLCCGQPPRLMSGEGFGYALICTECGNGLGGGFRGDTFQSAQFLWNRDFDISLIPKPTSVPLFLLKELNEAHDVLRNIACVLGVGGYNATDVDAKVFEKKILEGIDMLVKPLNDRIEQLEKEGLKTEKSLMASESSLLKMFIDSPEQIVSSVMCGQTKYTLFTNGDVLIQYLGSTLSDRTMRISSVALSVQQLFEEDLAKQKLNAALNASENEHG